MSEERKKHNLQLNASAQKSDILGLGMALHTFDPSPQEAKAEKSLRIQSQPGLQSCVPEQPTWRGPVSDRQKLDNLKYSFETLLG